MSASWTAKKDDEELHSDLVETLYGKAGSFVAGLFGSLIAPVIAWFSTSDPVYLWFILVIALIGAYRTYVNVAHEATPLAVRRRDALKWERLYAVGGIGAFCMVGLSVAYLFNHHYDDVLGVYSIVIMMSGLGSIAARNAGRPRIVLAQSIVLTLPFAISSALRHDWRYLGLIAILGLLIISIHSTTKFLHANLSAALRNGRDASNQRKKFSLALNSMTHGLCMGDADFSITVVNRRIVEFFGIVAATTPIRLDSLARSIGKSANMPAPAVEQFVERWKHHAGLQKANVFTYQIGERYFDFHCERAEGGVFITVIEDVTAQKRALLEIGRIARFDELTGLPNRYQFQDALTQQLAQVQQQDCPLALLNIDLDRFKEVNDTLGHPVGDQLLIAVARRLTDEVKAPNLVARLGGDEFCVLLPQSDGKLAVEETANRIIEAMHSPFDIDNHVIDIGASIGYAVAPTDADTPDGLLRCSDLALYYSKDHGRGKAIAYTPQMQEAMTRKREIEVDLRHAIEAEELVLYYQPVVDSRSRKVVALEALMRWRHSKRGLVSPADFIPIAEETGLIIELGAWALRQACRDALTLPEGIRVSVNLAPRQFQQNNLTQMIAAALRETGLPAHRLELEITESTLMMEHEKVEAKVQAIKELGVRLALDDFGTGYSSLSYLNRFPVNKVKIDRSFTRQALDSGKTQAIIGGISTLARDLDMDLVAEGVETVEQLAFMSSKNIFLIQGYLFSPPRPLADLAPQILTGFGVPERSAA